MSSNHIYYETCFDGLSGAYNVLSNDVSTNTSSIVDLSTAILDIVHIDDQTLMEKISAYLSEHGYDSGGGSGSGSSSNEFNDDALMDNIDALNGLL